MDGEAQRIVGVTRKVRTIILMPRWGVQRSIVKEKAITVARVSILETEGGYGEDNGPPPYAARAAE
ncbi:hypothetical protein EOA24_00665 [Mesorhizobium sp. M2A.F.Ca.ET.039.01.1.1]|nr:hypothetical protein EOA24_00665 [Mesorhizobium sp. M2A.F.Ca.ET.039.01.1.1]